MEKVFGTRYVQEIGIGNTKPVVIEANDKNMYVVKFKENRVSPKVLINEIICSRLGEKLDLPIPKAAVIGIIQDFIDVETELQRRNISVGDHFGSLYYPKTINFIGHKSIQDIENLEQIPRIIAFDLWVGNDDRSDNEGNILITTSYGCKKVIAIDYGNAFNGPDWCIDDLINTDIIIPPFDGSVYSCLKKVIKGDNPFDDICNEIENLSYYDIEQCTLNVPFTWGYNDTLQRLIANFLNDRKSELRLALNDLKPNFPNWR